MKSNEASLTVIAYTWILHAMKNLYDCGKVYACMHRHVDILMQPYAAEKVGLWDSIA